MALDQLPQPSIQRHGSFSFMDLLHGPSPLSPHSIGWGSGSVAAPVEAFTPEEENAPNNFQILLTSVHSEDQATPINSEMESRRESSSGSFSDSSSVGSSSMPDLFMWGIGDKPLSDRELPTTVVKSEPPSSPVSSTCAMKSNGRPIDRNCEKYKLRRERNNISVRKSRAKTKSKIKRIEDRVSLLEQENKGLKLKLMKVRKFLTEFESSFFNWRNVVRELDEELGPDAFK